MVEPTLESLELHERLRAASGGGYAFQCTPYWTPTPRFFKYYYWVYYRNCEAHGHGHVWQSEHRMCWSDMLRLSHTLSDRRKVHLIYGRRFPRQCPDTPLDEDSPMWRDCEWAPSWEDDADQEYEGQK